METWRTASVPCIVLRSRGERQISVTFSLLKEKHARNASLPARFNLAGKPQDTRAKPLLTFFCTSSCSYTCWKIKCSEPKSIFTDVEGLKLLRVMDFQQTNRQAEIAEAS